MAESKKYDKEKHQFTGDSDRSEIDGVAGLESAGVGTGHGPQTTDEAVLAEEMRRSEMSDAELDEAETRDRLVRSTDDHVEGDIPGVGSPDDETREDSNLTDAVVGPDERFGTTEEERTQP